MNDHDAERIAAAMHAARPDWPTNSLLTLIRKNLIDRPRRDVFVALAWVASESGSHTPARVLEAGPWWRAAGIEGGAAHHETYDPAVTCGICGKPERTCRANRWAEHDYIDAVHDAIANPKRPADAMRAIVQDARNSIAIAEPKEQPMTERQPNEHVEELRAVLAGASEESA